MPWPRTQRNTFATVQPSNSLDNDHVVHCLTCSSLWKKTILLCHTDIIVFNVITFFVAGYSAAAKAAKYGTYRVFC